MKQDEKTKEIFLEIINSMIDKKYTKGWINPFTKPTNFTTLKPYLGWNEFILNAIGNYKDYLPYYGTFNQFYDNGVKVLKGEKAISIGYWNFFYTNGKVKYSIAQYEELLKTLTKEELDKLKLEKKAFYKGFSVFSISQTNFAEIFPDSELLKTKKVVKTDILNLEIIDKLMNEWVCPINIKKTDKAYYVPTLDKIVLPLKEQFFSDKEFYITAFHEMAHSTGHKSRLNRFDKSYEEEEVIAEFASCMLAIKFNIQTKPCDNNILYIKSYFEESFDLKNLMIKVSQIVKFFNTYIEENIDETIEVSKELKGV